MSDVIQTLNYSSQAIDDFLGHAKAWATSNPVAAKSLITTATQLRESEKFILPENGNLLGVDVLKEHYSDLLRIPYPTIALEFPTTLTFNGGSKKNILLCWTGTDFIDRNTWQGEIEPGQESEIICFTNIFWSEQQRTWLPSPFAFWFHRECLLPMDQTSRTKWQVHMVESTSCLDLLASMPPEQYDMEANHNLKVGMDVILEFCLTVNCENVEQVSLPAPKLLNRKRLEKGRESFYSYRILAIPGHNTQGTTGAGSHASPRLHLRRGHLRRLATGKVTWVRHTMVGSVDKGVVEKTYAVR